MPGKSAFELICGFLICVSIMHPPCVGAQTNHTPQARPENAPRAIGIIEDERGKRLPGLVVSITDERGTTIDKPFQAGKNGFFFFQVPGEGVYLLIVACYEPKLQRVTKGRNPGDPDLHFGEVRLTQVHECKTSPCEGQEAPKPEGAQTSASQPAAGPSYTLRFTSPAFGSPGILQWLPAAVALTALIFQVLAIAKYRSSPPANFTTMLTDLDNTLKRLKSDIFSAKSKWEKELALARADALRMEGSGTALPAGTQPGEESGGFVPGKGSARIPETAWYQPIVLSDVEQSGGGVWRADKVNVIEDYEQARMSPDCEAAIQAFERRYSCIRLSLANEKDVVYIPGTKAEFEEDNRGWFLGVEENGQMLCFPWFSLDPAQQRQTFQAAFDYIGVSSRVSSPARLSKLGARWVLITDKGSIGGA